MKKKTIFLFYITFGLNTAVIKSSENFIPENNKNQTDENNTVNDSESEIDSLINMSNTVSLPAPKFENPSVLKIWLRQFGIGLLYKYHSFKTWTLLNINKIMAFLSS